MAEFEFILTSALPVGEAEIRHFLGQRRGKEGTIAKQPTELLPESRLRERLHASVASIQRILSSLPDDDSYVIDTATFELGITAGGKIALFGELSTEANSSITLTFKRVQTHSKTGDKQDR